MALTKRVELLFDPDQYACLEEVARARGESVAALIRRAVEQEYLQPSLDEKRKALEALLSQEIDVGTWEEAKEAIAQDMVKRIEAP